MQGGHDRNGICNDNIRRQLDSFRHMLFDQLRIASGKSSFDLDIATIYPTQISHTKSELFNAALRLEVLLLEAKQYDDSSHALRRLRMYRAWPSGC
jgi:hypothetical protein